jgi:hypothetical protein
MSTGFTGPYAVAPLAGGSIKCSSTHGGRCELPAVVPGVPGHYYCAACAQFCPQAMAKLRNAQALREKHFAMAENYGGMDWGGEGARPDVGRRQR